MFGKKAREIQFLKRVLESRIILKGPEDEELFNASFEYIIAISRILSPNPFLTEFFKMARIEVRLSKEAIEISKLWGKLDERRKT